MANPHKRTKESKYTLKLNSFMPHLSKVLRKKQEEEEEEEENHMQAALTIYSENSNSPFTDLPAPVAAPPNKVVYFLSSGARTASFGARTRSRISHGTSPFSSSSSLSPAAKSSSFFSHDAPSDAQFELPPINFFDFMKSLLSQLAASISAMKVAYAHQQAALNPHNIRQGRGCAQEISMSRSGMSVTDKAMVEGLERLSQIHWQLSLLPHMKLQEQNCACSEGADTQKEVKTTEMNDSVMLNRYEGIITMFHDEMRRKDAVTAALKETLAKSMLQAEKLARRVKALEADRLFKPLERD